MFAQNQTSASKFLTSSRRRRPRSPNASQAMVSQFLVLLLRQQGSAGVLEIRRHRAGEFAVLVDVQVVVVVGLLGVVPPLAGFPISAQLVHLVHKVEIRVVVLPHPGQPLVQGQMFGVHGRPVVFMLPAGANELPAPLLLLQIQAGGVGQKEPGDQHAAEAEPRHHVELRLRVDVVVHDRRQQRAQLAAGRGEAVGGGADGRGVDFGRDQEGDGVGAELVEEGREKVHGLEADDVFLLGEVVVVKRRDHEQDKIHEEADHLHLLAPVELVIDQEGCTELACRRQPSTSGNATHTPGNTRPGRRPR